MLISLLAASSTLAVFGCRGARRGSGSNGRCSKEKTTPEKVFQLKTKRASYDFDAVVVSGELPSNMLVNTHLDLSTIDNPFVKFLSRQRINGRHCIEMKLDYFRCDGRVCSRHGRIHEHGNKRQTVGQWTSDRVQSYSCKKKAAVEVFAMYRAPDNLSYVGCSAISYCSSTHGQIDQFERLCTGLKVRLTRKKSIL